MMLPADIPYNWVMLWCATDGSFRTEGECCVVFFVCVCACWIVIPLCTDGDRDHFACNWHAKIKLVQERESDE